MSLDILLYQKCDPEEATRAFDILDYPHLKALQPSGIVCAKRVFHRIGRNCLNKAWHKNFDNESTETRFVYMREDWEDIRVHFRAKFKPGQYFEDPPADGWDFMYISW